VNHVAQIVGTPACVTPSGGGGCRAAAAYKAQFDLSSYGWWTILAFFLCVAGMAGVVEEAAFRGYMLSIAERRHGWLVAIVAVMVLFYAVHLSHAYATAGFVPFFVAYSVLHGLLVFFTRSILPNVVLHSVGDFVILPIQYGVIPNPLGSSVRLHALVILVFGALSALAFWHLARVSRLNGRVEMANGS
jgi:membrane protease YdiL (CAAX protease family)